MKKIFYLFVLLVVAIVVINNISCSGDDENPPSNYTTEEIVEILNGKWAIKGTYKFNRYRIIDTTYTATIEFQDDKKYKIRDVLLNGKHSYDWDLFYSSPGNSGSYNILRKGGETYISLNEFDFKIISLTQKSFLFVYDGDYYNNGLHLYISMETY